MIDFLIKKVWDELNKIPEHRADNKSYDLIDCLMGSFAMFSLKDRSLLSFRQKYAERSANLNRVYQLKSIPVDSALRSAIDGVQPSDLQRIFPEMIEELYKRGVLQKRKVLSGQYYLVAGDGTQHYCSCSKCCPHCLVREHRNGTKSYYHQMLAAVLLHPEDASVFPVACEPIVRQDGSCKNDCETNAGKRLLPQIRACLPKDKYAKILLTLDALYGTGPFIKCLKDQAINYMIRIKEGFVKLQAQRLRQAGKLKARKWQKGNTIYWIEYTNGLILNGSHPDIETNYIRYTELDAQTGEIIFDAEWITDIKITYWNCLELSQCGRKRWKVENETFNTLKNQGYNFKHNYGHGKQYLTSNFALLTFLAFLIDQISQQLDIDFQKAWKKCKSKVELWIDIRKTFDFFPATSMGAIYRFISGVSQIELPLLE